MIHLEIRWDSRTLKNRIQKGKTEIADVPRRDMQAIGRFAVSRAKDLSQQASGKYSSSWRFRTIQFADSVELSLENTDEKAKMLLFGTKPHVILPHGKALRFNTADGVVFTKRVNHPGTKGRDIFSELSDSGEIDSEAERIFESSLRRISEQL